MKIKLILAKYLDWAILAVLGVWLLYAIFQAFVVEDRSLQELKGDIRRLVKVCDDELKNPTADPIPVPKHRDELEKRFERLPVMSSFTHNPFAPRKVIPWPPFQMVKGDTKDLLAKDIQIVEILPYDKAILGISSEYDPDKSSSMVKILATNSGDTTFKLRDITDTIYVCRVIVTKTKELPPPDRPLSTRVLACKAIEVGTVRKEARVLIAFLPDNPGLDEPGRGITNRAEILRKRFGAADSEYANLTPNMIDPLTPAQAVALRKEWLGADIMKVGEEASERARAPVVPRHRPRTYEPQEPEAADEWIRKQQARTERSRPTQREPAQAHSLDLLLRAKSFAYVDTTVDEGESYVYKVVTIAYDPKRPPKRCAEPYVTPRPIEIPSLVEFVPLNISLLTTGFQVSRPRPDTHQTITQKFRVDNGMLIGMPIEIRERRVDKTPGPKYNYVNVDFSTNCVLVIGLGGVRRMEYRPVGYDHRKKRLKYYVIPRRDEQAVYLTRQGSLRWKGEGSAIAKERSRVPTEEPGRPPVERR